MKRLLLAISSGLLMALALPQAIPWIRLGEIDPAGHLEWLAWIALVPALLALDGARTWRSALGLGLAAGLAYFYGAIWWVNHAMTAFGGVPLPLALLGLTFLVLYMAVHWAAAFLVSWVVRRRLGWPWWAHLPAIWVATELSRNYLFTGFPWGNLGYVQARHLAVSQLASVTGIYGIAALVVLVNCAIHALVRALADRRPLPWRLAAATALAVAAVVGYGFAHLGSMRARAAAAPRLRVGLVQGNVNQSVKNQRAARADFVLGRYVPLTVEADRRGADLVAWPEATYPYLVPPDIASFAGARSGLPRLSHAHLLLGASTYAERRGADGRREMLGSNTLFLLRPDLVVQEPGSALRVLSFEPGPPAAQLAAAGAAPDPARLAPMICFDAIFPEVNVEYAAQDPEVLVNPTNDAWYGYSSGPYQFLAIVRLRAIEAGKAVARPAYAGVTALVEPTGEVQPGALPVGPVDPDLAPDPDEPPRLLMGEVPRLRGRTLYTRVGDLFAGAASLYGAIVLALALRRRGPSREGATG
jgi:apolipoprotein N-acyltransferase